MDIATLIGIIGAFVIVITAVFIGGSFAQFIDLPAVLIVFGGASAATLVRFQLSDITTAFKTGSRVALAGKSTTPRDLIAEIAHLGEIVRKTGPLGLENVDVSDPVLAKGVQYIADGYEQAFIRESMERERDLQLSRLSEGRRVFKALGDSAPAFGMIGTLIGLVQMLANMDDPAAIGPSMAVALLTTLYGALLANVVFLPLVDKLDAKFDADELNQTLIIDGVMQIRESKSPALIKEMLVAYLPENHRSEFEDAA
ncbi:motility protein A [Roseibium sp. RKSG952]|uniref:motility protein A n=1 Tax=Roseibium sp. RKSG952 TaxID=2529384 RepID=UPI0012BCBC55|nr:MotA/TolQ/ExbB proton channel family protein [Roseibium sp. RKSG952]MTI00104.1 flagellar motor protein PomA [Roseibium sp. RKSG952]